MCDFDDCDIAMAEMDMDMNVDEPMPDEEDAEVENIAPTTADPSKPAPANEKPTTKSAFHDFVVKIGTVKNPKDQPITHVMMDQGRLLQTYKGKWTFGGRLSVKHQGTMFKAVVDDHNEGIMHPLVEAFPVKSRLALDFDFKTPERLTDEQIYQYTTAAQMLIKTKLQPLQEEEDAVQEEYSVLDDTFTAVVCKVVGGQRVQDGKVKTGVHMIWPNLIVDHAQASTLVDEVIKPGLQEGYVGVDWSDTVDDSIYHKGKGLRLCFTIKRLTCKDCTVLEDQYKKRRGNCPDKCQYNKQCSHCKPGLLRNADCGKCHGKVVIPGTDHHYVPAYVLQPDGARHERATAQLVEDKMVALQYTCVTPATAQKSTTFKLPTADKTKKRKAAAPTKGKKRQKGAAAAAGAEPAENDEVHDSDTENNLDARPDVVQLTFEEVEAHYKAAGGTHTLIETPGHDQGTVVWFEQSPGHDQRNCLVETCPTRVEGNKHTQNAVIKEDSRGLKYICLSQNVHRYIWEREEASIEELVCGGDIGLARLFYRTRRDYIVNVGGDGSQCKFLVFNDRTGLWQHSYPSDIRSHLQLTP
jgi:hypothetical protein